MNRAVAASALCLVTFNATAGVPVTGGYLVRQDALGVVQALACEAIVCLSLISAPGPSCERSLAWFDELDALQRVRSLAMCPQAKSFDLADVIKGRTSAPRSSQATKGRP